MHCRLFSSHVLSVAILLIVGTGSPSAQTTADLFDQGTLHTLELTVHSRDWNALHASFNENVYYPADVTWNGIRVRNAGLRSRGYGSRSGIKPGLDLDFRRFNARGSFLGLRSLVLDNLTTDASMIRERVAMAFLRRFGVPASREAHARVFVNGEYAGLYAVVEPIDAAFVQDAFGDRYGTLLEFRWQGPYFGDYLGDNLDLYRPWFEPRPAQNRSIFDLYGPVRELFRAVNETRPEQFRDSVDTLLDLDATLRLIAAEAFLAESDGWLGSEGMNNFYLRRPSTSQRHRIVPWDRDHSFSRWDLPVMTGAAENALMRRVLEDADLRAEYTNLLLEAAGHAAASDWLLREIQTEYEQIHDAALADPLKPFANEEFEQAIADLMAFARTRPSFVVQDVQQLQVP